MLQRWLIIDEISMISARFLADIGARLRAAMKAIGTMKHDSMMHERPFGGGSMSSSQATSGSWTRRNLAV